MLPYQECDNMVIRPGDRWMGEDGRGGGVGLLGWGSET